MPGRLDPVRFSSGGDVIPHDEKSADKTTSGTPVLRNLISHRKICIASH
jgi:hypothetical protein